MKIFIPLAAFLSAGTAAAQTPQTASGPATTGAAAPHYERIAEKKLPDLRAVRPSDFSFPNPFGDSSNKPFDPRKHYPQAIPFQPPVTADLDGDGHRDFALAMKTRHAHSIFAFYIVACLWRKTGYDCRRISRPRVSNISTDRLEVGDVSNDSRCWGAQKKRTWKAPTLVLDPYLGNIVTYYPYDKARDKFHRCDFGD